MNILVFSMSLILGFLYDGCKCIKFVLSSQRMVETFAEEVTQYSVFNGFLHLNEA